jgi:hypothetical protein
VERNPRAIVLAPKLSEGHWMLNILFSYDRAVHRLRLNAGRPGFSLEMMTEVAEKITTFNDKIDEVIKAMGGGYYTVFGATFFNTQTLEMKRLLVQTQGGRPFDPHTSEGRKMAEYIAVFDIALLQLKDGLDISAGDVKKNDFIFKEIMKLIARFYKLTEYLWGAAKMDRNFTAPQAVRSIAKYLDEEEQGEQAESGQAGDEGKKVRRIANV